MTKEEIRDLLEMNYDNNREWLVNYIVTLESECNRFKKGMELARELMDDMVSKDRYNDLVKRYNKLVNKNK